MVPSRRVLPSSASGEEPGELENSAAGIRVRAGSRPLRPGRRRFREGGAEPARGGGASGLFFPAGVGRGVTQRWSSFAFVVFPSCELGRKPSWLGVRDGKRMMFAELGKFAGKPRRSRLKALLQTAVPGFATPREVGVPNRRLVQGSTIVKKTTTPKRESST